MSVLLRGTQGYGLERYLRTDRLLTLSKDLPLLAVASMPSLALTVTGRTAAGRTAAASPCRTARRS